MVTWTEQQVRDHQTRQKARTPEAQPDRPSGDESNLQEQIINECKRRGWFAVYSRMDLPTTQPLGTPDLIIFAGKGRVLLFEAKSRSGKLTPAQLGVKVMLESLGHTVNVVRSFGQFLDLI